MGTLKIRKDSSFNIKQQQLMNAVTKQSLLACYSLLMIIALMLIGIVLYILHIFTSIPSKTETMTEWMRWFLLIERMTEVTSIHLSFVMNDKIYQIVCKKCHNFFQNQCHKLAEKQIVENNKKNEKELSTKHDDLPPLPPKKKNLFTLKSDSSINGGPNEDEENIDIDIDKFIDDDNAEKHD